jgi:hypothetical protein
MHDEPQIKTRVTEFSDFVFFAGPKRSLPESSRQLPMPLVGLAKNKNKDITKTKKRAGF